MAIGGIQIWDISMEIWVLLFFCSFDQFVNIDMSICVSLHLSIDRPVDLSIFLCTITDVHMYMYLYQYTYTYMYEYVNMYM